MTDDISGARSEARRAQWRWTLVVALLAVLLAACGGTGADSAQSGELTKNRDGYIDLSVEQLATMMDNKDFTLVNVHVPYEGELPQTDLFIPYDQIGDHLGELPDKGAPIVLYCRSGSMSTTAAEVLVDEGYTNVMELDGGFNRWKAEGYELLDTR